MEFDTMKSMATSLIDWSMENAWKMRKVFPLDFTVRIAFHPLPPATFNIHENHRERKQYENVTRMCLRGKTRRASPSHQKPLHKTAIYHFVVVALDDYYYCDSYYYCCLFVFYWIYFLIVRFFFLFDALNDYLSWHHVNDLRPIKTTPDTWHFRITTPNHQLDPKKQKEETQKEETHELGTDPHRSVVCQLDCY